MNSPLLVVVILHFGFYQVGYSIWHKKKRLHPHIWALSRFQKQSFVNRSSSLETRNVNGSLVFQQNVNAIV